MWLSEKKQKKLVGVVKRISLWCRDDYLNSVLHGGRHAERHGGYDTAPEQFLQGVPDQPEAGQDRIHDQLEQRDEGQNEHGVRDVHLLRQNGQTPNLAVHVFRLENPPRSLKSNWNYWGYEMIKFLRNSFMQYKKRKIQIEMRNKY